jgi:hypothetical protein
MVMRPEDDVRTEFQQLQAKLRAAFQRKAQWPEGSPAWEQAEREITRLSRLGTALGWVLEEIDDIETMYFPLPQHPQSDDAMPLGEFWRDQLDDLPL